MNFKTTAPIIIVFILVTGFLTFEITNGNLEEVLFDKIPYNYTSHVWVPPNDPNGGSLGGFYQIYGQGKNFNFFIKLPGAEGAENPLDYTKDGLNGTGTINNVDITYDTIIALLYGDYKKAMFTTKFDGTFNMNCAAWTGYGNFSNDGKNFPGNFKIIGPLTDWEGTFNITEENDKIALHMDYILYPHGQKSPEKIKEAKKTIYM